MIVGKQWMDRGDVDKTIFRYGPTDGFRVGECYLLKGLGKGTILSICTEDNLIITDADVLVPVEAVRQFTAMLLDGRVITACPTPRSLDGTARPASRKYHRLVLAGKKGVWLRRHTSG